MNVQELYNKLAEEIKAGRGNLPIGTEERAYSLETGMTFYFTEILYCDRINKKDSYGQKHGISNKPTSVVLR